MFGCAVGVAGPNVTLGYWQDEKATKDTFVGGGWLRTGDCFRVDEKGTFLFVPSPPGMSLDSSNDC